MSSKPTTRIESQKPTSKFQKETSSPTPVGMQKQTRATTPSAQTSTRPQSSLTQTSGRAPQIRKVNGYLVYFDALLGEGVYGKVVKCYLASDKEQAYPYACKIIDVKRISAEDLECIHKEVRIHSLVRSEYCVRLHQTIKTSSNIYMVQELCNGFDLSQLLKVKKTLT
jgi:hypothetical protein